MFCQHCGAQLENGVAICTKCGFAVGTGDRHYCTGCGIAIEPGQAFCTACGTALNTDAGNLGKSTRSKMIAGILGILLGSLGIHNFYLGKTKRGLIQLLVSVLSCGIAATPMGIWGLVEGIFYLVGYAGYTTDAEGKTLID